MKTYRGFAARKGDGPKERMVLAIDVSRSMKSNDWSPSRLKGAAAAGKELIGVKADRYPEDEVGVVAFSTRARVIHRPMDVASGASALKDSLARLRCETSTNIRDGLQVAGEMLYDGDSGKTAGGTGGVLKWLSKVIYGDGESHVGLPPASGKTLHRIILLTDGEHNEGPGPRRIAQKLKAKGAVIHCVGIGGSPGDVDERLLKAIASTAPDGKPCYCFIADKQNLIREFKRLANRIRPA